MRTKTLMTPVIVAALALSIGACGKKDKPVADGGSAKSAEIPASVIASTAPDGALSVVEARAAAKPGEPITLRGKVGGKMKPISDAAAILVLADEKAIKSCDENPDDLCETPWDYCCEESATIAASTATIQVRDADGKLVRATLRGMSDLKELSHIVVSGTVDATSTATALIVNADKIHVEKP